MANNKLYENYLMHYRTKGSKNGYTKYPDKYTPIGEKAGKSGNISDWYNNGQSFGSNLYNTQSSSTKRKKYPEMSPVLNGVRAATIAGTSGYVKGKNEQNKRKQNQQAAEQRRIAGGRTYGTGTRLTRENDRFDKIHEGSSKLYNAAVYTRNLAKEATKKPKPTKVSEYPEGLKISTKISDVNKRNAEQRRIEGAPIKKTADYWRRQKELSSKESRLRNSRSDIGNAVADAKEDLTKIKNKGKKKVKSLLKRFFG